MAAPTTKADEAQAERLHRFAHDLRNRLAGIKQVLDQLAAPDGGMDPAELAHFGEQQFFKAMRQVEELLDDLGVERGMRPVPGTPTDMEALAQRAIAGLAHRFSRKEQRIDTRLEPGLLAMADARLAEDLVGALLSNASKFTPRGGSITVALAQEDGNAMLRVTDTGIGLDAEDLGKVFVRYAWLAGRTTDGEAQGRSTLARARQQAEAMAGSLTAESDGAGRGSSFVLRLPLA